MPHTYEAAVARTARNSRPLAAFSKTIGISAVATYQPPWVLDNDWFGDALSRKFVRHTGILSRRISLEDEVTLGVRAVERLRQQTGCDPRNCLLVVFAGSSLVHRGVARRYLSVEQARRENCGAAARELVERLGLPSARAVGINWGCSGYAKAMEIAARCAARYARLRRDQFILVVTANRTSKITDYGCKATAPIFGDFAQATLLGGADSGRHPIELALVYAAAERRPADGVFFDFQLRENVTVPKPDGGRAVEPRRLVFSMDMMGLGDGAPRAMAAAAAKALAAARIDPAEVDFVVPHQAGTSVVALAAMKLEQLGIRGQVVNGLTRTVGNISSSSVPYALEQSWGRLHGTILCPTAAVGRPGSASLTQGCIILKATRPPARATTAPAGALDWQSSATSAFQATAQ
jgi:3-oxoacyl-[acyl-carrier-protein] synthase-3